MSKYRVQLDRDNQSALAKSAKANGRSAVKEVNHILREHFANERLARQESDVNPAKLKP